MHYLDLSEEEFDYFKLRDVNYADITLFVQRRHILIDENILSIRRLDVLPTPQDDPVSEITKTERIFFAKFEPLLAKCENRFFFAHDNLKNEYVMLLKNTKLPMGTTIRVKKHRIIANRAENVLNILEADAKLSNKHTLYVLTSDATNDDVTQVEVDGNEQWERYIVNHDNELVIVDHSLLHYVNGKEIFAVYDIVKERPVDDDDAVSTDQQIDNDHNTDREDEEDTDSENSATSTEEEFVTLVDLKSFSFHEMIYKNCMRFSVNSK